MIHATYTLVTHSSQMAASSRHSGNPSSHLASLSPPPAPDNLPPCRAGPCRAGGAQCAVPLRGGRALRPLDLHRTAPGAAPSAPQRCPRAPSLRGRGGGENPIGAAPAGLVGGGGGRAPPIHPILLATQGGVVPGVPEGESGAPSQCFEGGARPSRLLIFSARHHGRLVITY